MTGLELDPVHRDLIDHAPCGYLIMDETGRVLAANDRLLTWLGLSASELRAMPATNIFSVASRVVFETSLAPLLQLQKQVEGVSLDLKAQNGRKIPVLLSAECTGDGPDRVTRMVLLTASVRRNFERELVQERSEAEASLLQKQREGELREQFVAVLGHDLRNPLASISASNRMLSREPLSARGGQILQLVQGSVHRMSRLIDNVLDFTRHRLGGGLDLDFTNGEKLEAQLRQIVGEMRSAAPDREVRVNMAIRHEVRCDVWRIGQLFSNLLGNALTYGDPLHPVLVDASTCDGGGFNLHVCNRGTPIPAADMEQLFEPFVRSTDPADRKGLGLGLYIAMEIAKAHGGGMDVTSDKNETCFTFRMPGGQSNP